MLSVDTAPEKFENTTATSHFGIEFDPALLNFSGFKSIFEKLRFRNRLVCTVGLAMLVKLRFQIS